MKRSHHVPDFLLQIAEGFYQIGFDAAVNAYKEPDKRLRHIVAGAVNMGFAAELILKGLLLVTVKKNPWSHKLTELFGLLELPMRQQIEMRFNEQQVKPNSKEMLRSYIFTVTKEGESKDINSSEKGLNTFLEVHDKTFETWRYVHEIPEDGFYYQMDFISMNNFIKIVLEALDSIEWDGRFHRIG